MPSTRTEARDEIAAALLEGFDQLDITTVIWDSTRQQIPDRGKTPAPRWARVLIRHLASEQSTLADKAGCRRFTRSGLVTVQLFLPTNDGLRLNDEYSEQLAGSLEGVSRPGGVWFRDVRINEVGEDGPWFQTNVLANFEYDGVR